MACLVYLHHSINDRFKINRYYLGIIHLVRTQNFLKN